MPTILKNNIRLGGKTPTNILLGGKDVKYAKLGNTVVYDTLSHYSYNTPSITFTYPSGNVSYSGGSKTPSARTWSLTYYAVGHSGALYGPYTTSGTVSSFSIVSGSSYGLLNTSTGVFTFNANSSTSTRSVTIRATITANGKTATKDVTITQAAMPVYTATITWSNWDLHDGASWCLTNSPVRPTSSSGMYFSNSSNTATHSFVPGGPLQVNQTEGGSLVEVANQGTVYAFYWHPAQKWYAIGSFAHLANKSYSVTL